MFTGIFNGEHICSLNMTDDEWKHERKESSGFRSLASRMTNSC